VSFFNRNQTVTVLLSEQHVEGNVSPIMAAAADGLIQWAKLRGAVFHDSTITRHPPGGRGLFNTKAITGEDAQNQTALFVPKSLFITLGTVAEAANEYPELNIILDAFGTVEMSVRDHSPMLTIFLLHQVYLQKHNKPSKWAIYLHFLPRFTFHPITWNEQELEVLRIANLSISHKVPHKISQVRSLYLLFKSWNRFKPVDWFENVTWDQFALVESWVTTRAFRDPKTKEPFLVPILDMANHSSNPNATIEHTKEGIELRRENVDIASGAELTVSYGFSLSQDTGEMLYRYGFIADPSPIPSNAMDMRWKIGQISTEKDHFFRVWPSMHKRFHDLPFFTFENW
jgi:hypothetical protein